MENFLVAQNALHVNTVIISPIILFKKRSPPIYNCIGREMFSYHINIKIYY